MGIDVFVPDLKLGFEFQGVQHFQPIDYFGGGKTFIEHVKRDNVKKKYCVENGIIFIEAFYDEKLSKDLIEKKILMSEINISHKSVDN
jgi:hypothetical protein